MFLHLTIYKYRVCSIVLHLVECYAHTYNMDPTKLVTPFSMSLYGPRGVGKTHFTLQLIQNQNRLIDSPFKKIVWIYKHHQPLVFDQLYNGDFEIEFLNHIPNFSTWGHQPGTLVVLDDFMAQASNNEEVANLFTTGRHLGISVIYMVQNMFPKGKYSRDISLNCDYGVSFKNVRDQSQIHYLARQMYPKNPEFLSWAYRKATEKPYGYLFIDFKTNTKNDFRLRRDLFGEYPIYFTEIL